MNLLLPDPVVPIIFDFLRKGNIWEPPVNLPLTPRLDKPEEIIFFIPRPEAIRYLLAIGSASDVLEHDRKRARTALARCFGYRESRNGYGV